ncbi:MAG TPA: peptide-methionine (S)-S-oxide reductase MsrA [Bryobacteraceae bacterium]|nr:peptide-methionine (S)-S-oxide reductase MsrA [Bryobacteraceae bacterium]
MKTVLLLAFCGAGAMAANVPPPSFDLPAPAAGKVATAVLAGGSFWQMESVFEKLQGVIAVVAGYAGGKAGDAQEATVASGRTKHAECVQITYDPSRISYGRLLQVFFAVAHDPTAIDRQGPDTGPQFRSAIFYSSEGQKQVAQAYIRQIERAHVFQRPIQTQVTLLTGFFTAEDHNQHYARRNPNDPYVTQNIAPKLKALEEQFPNLLKP